MNKIWSALIILGIVAFVSCTSRNKELTLLKVTELGSARISDSAIVALLQRELGEKTRITYDLSEDKVLNSLRNRSVDMAIIPNNTIINDPKLEVHTILPLLLRILVIMNHNISGSYGSNIKELFENNTIVYEAMSRMDSIFFKIFFRSFGIESNKISSVIAQGINLNEWADSSFLFVGLTHLHNPMMQKLIDQGASFVSLDKVSQLGKDSSVEGFKVSFQSSCPFVLPKSFYKGKPDSPVLTIAIDDILVGLSDLDNILVYNVAKTLIEDNSQLVQFDNIYNMLKTDFDAESFSFPLHAGTEQYISRDKASIWTRYALLI